MATSKDLGELNDGSCVGASCNGCNLDILHMKNLLNLSMIKPLLPVLGGNLCVPK